MLIGQRIFQVVVVAVMAEMMTTIHTEEPKFTVRLLIKPDASYTKDQVWMTSGAKDLVSLQVAFVRYALIVTATM